MVMRVLEDRARGCSIVMWSGLHIIVQMRDLVHRPHTYPYPLCLGRWLARAVLKLHKHSAAGCTHLGEKLSKELGFSGEPAPCMIAVAHPELDFGHIRPFAVCAPVLQPKS